MKIIDKIIWSYEQPRQTNVLWFDATNNILKIYNAGAWQDMTGSSKGGSTINEIKAGIKCGDGRNMFNLLDAISTNSVYEPIIDSFEKGVSGTILNKFYNDGGIDVIIVPVPISETACDITVETKYFQIVTNLTVETDYDTPEEAKRLVVGGFLNNPEYEGFIKYYNSLVTKFKDSDDVTVPSISDLSDTFATVFGATIASICEQFDIESFLAIIEA